MPRKTRYYYAVLLPVWRKHPEFKGMDNPRRIKIYRFKSDESRWAWCSVVKQHEECRRPIDKALAQYCCGYVKGKKENVLDTPSGLYKKMERNSDKKTASWEKLPDQKWKNGMWIYSSRPLNMAELLSGVINRDERYYPK